MTDTTFDGTIDWNDYWDGSAEVSEDDANGGATLLLDPFAEFLAQTGGLESYADVGCGGGAVVFDVADRYPDATVVGYEAAEPVLAADRERAREEGVENVAFERAVLPAFDPERQFEVVSAFYTLCYVADVERALRNLYEAVAPGGSLVFTYHNRFARSIFESIAEAPGEHLDESAAWRPETFADRFELVIEGENLLSYDRIHDALGTWPRSVWSVTGEAERYPAWRQNPFVYVPK